MLPPSNDILYWFVAVQNVFFQNLIWVQSWPDWKQSGSRNDRSRTLGVSPATIAWTWVKQVSSDVIFSKLGFSSRDTHRMLNTVPLHFLSQIAKQRQPRSPIQKQITFTDYTILNACPENSARCACGLSWRRSWRSNLLTRALKGL